MQSLMNAQNKAIRAYEARPTPSAGRDDHHDC
jgi:hypothetical protein